MKYIIVSRHEATVEYLRKVFPAAEVVGGLPQDWYDKEAILVGNVPLWLASRAHSVIAVEFLVQPPRGVELTAEDLEQFGIRLVEYVVEQKGEVYPT